MEEQGKRERVMENWGFTFSHAHAYLALKQPHIHVAMPINPTISNGTNSSSF